MSSHDVTADGPRAPLRSEERVVIVPITPRASTPASGDDQPALRPARRAEIEHEPSACPSPAVSATSTSPDRATSMSRVSTSITSFSADDTVFVDAHKGKGNKDPFACEPWSTFRSEMFASFETRHEQYRIAHEAQLSDFESRLTAALNTAFAQQNKSIDERFKQMDQKMDERFKAMDERMDERFDEMDKRMDERFDQMDKRISRLNRDLGEVIYKGNNLVRSTRDLVDWTEKLDMTVRSLVKTVDRHTVDLKDIRERLDSIVSCQCER